MDGSIIIWDGKTFGMHLNRIALCINRILTIHKLDKVKRLNHPGELVKGVTWDPAGKFIASQV
jgi:hypothetical protein